MAHLIVEKGENTGEKIPLSKLTNIGRSSDVDLQLDDLTVSKRHARILRNEKAQYVLEDLGSSNGTYLNGVQVKTKPLKEGDQIQVGKTVLTFHRPEEESAAIPRTSTETMLDIERGGKDSSQVRSSVDVDLTEQDAAAIGESTLEDLSRTNYRLRTLLEIGQSIGTALDEDELLNKILDSLFEVFPETNRGFIILRDPETGRLTPRASRVTRGEGAEETLQISETILEYVLKRKKGVLIEDTMSDERLPTSQSILDFEMRSVMCAPLKYEDEVLGFLQVDTDRIATNYDEEGLTLLVGIANQAALTIANARLHRQVIQRERLDRDLQHARRIQNSFLPQEPPKVEGYAFEDRYATALEVGGDFYDFVETPAGDLLIVVGDVSGKGITAALMMAKMASNVRFFASTASGPGQLLERLNEVALSSETDMFVTVLVMYLDPEEHTIRMSNAGHCYPVVRKQDGDVQRIEGANGFPVAITMEAEFPEISFEVDPGDVLCLFTDGIIEAMDESKNQFGYDKLNDCLRNAEASPEDVVKHIQRGIRDHTGMAPQSDDLTLVCFGRTNEVDSGE